MTTMEPDAVWCFTTMFLKKHMIEDPTSPIIIKDKHYKLREIQV